MHDAAHALDLKPPRPGRWGTPLLLALIAHALLMAALTWGVHWTKDEEQPVSFEAELWSALPKEAAPRAVQTPPPEPEPVSKPEPKPLPEPTPKPVAKPTPPPPKQTVKAPDIATEKARKKREDDQQRAQEAAKKDAALKEKARKDKLEKERQEKEKERKLALAAEKKAKDTNIQDDKKKRDSAQRADNQRKAEAAAREDQMRRIMGQAGASGGPEARGTAQQSSGPSAGYGSRVAARIRPNIRATEDFSRSLKTEIEVRTTPDGSIIGRRVVASSGNAAWDDAALRAIDRTGSLPRDVDGRVPSTLIVVVRPAD